MCAQHIPGVAWSMCEPVQMLRPQYSVVAMCRGALSHLEWLPRVGDTTALQPGGRREAASCPGSVPGFLRAKVSVALLVSSSACATGGTRGKHRATQLVRGSGPGARHMYETRCRPAAEPSVMISTLCRENAR